MLNIDSFHQSFNLCLLLLVTRISLYLWGLFAIESCRSSELPLFDFQLVNFLHLNSKILAWSHWLLMRSFCFFLFFLKENKKNSQLLHQYLNKALIMWRFVNLLIEFTRFPPHNLLRNKIVIFIITLDHVHLLILFNQCLESYQEKFYTLRIY